MQTLSLTPNTIRPLPESELLFLDQVMRQPDTALAISVSGGKDSHAMVAAIAKTYQERKWQAAVLLIHADLGRAEWKESMEMCQKLASQYNVPLVVVRRKKGDLLDRFEERIEALEGTGKPFWPSASARYCTSDLKREPINKHLRQYPLVISAEGLRAEESPARAKKAPLTIRKHITGKAYTDLSPQEAWVKWNENDRNGRLSWTWFPILDYTIDDVWAAIGTSAAELETRRKLYKNGQKEEALEGWPTHPAYVLGNNRVSCVFCVLGCLSDLQNGAVHYPDLLDTYIVLEERGNATFKNGFSLVELLQSDENGRMMELQVQECGAM